jgi:hypothetical protein
MLTKNELMKAKVTTEEDRKEVEVERMEAVMLRLNLLWVTRSSSSTIPTITDNCE